MALRAPPVRQLHRSNRLTVVPTVEPSTAAELRTHLVVTATELPDAEADSLIEEARQFIEDKLGFALTTQTWRMTLDRWPGRAEPWWDGMRQGSMNNLYSPDYDVAIEFPRSPVQSVTGINVYDEADTATAVTVADVFQVDAYSMPGRLSLKHGATWPVALRVANAIEITYVAGYGDAAADIPATIRRAIRMLASKMFSERGDGCSVEDAYVSSGAEGILSNYRIARI